MLSITNGVRRNGNPYARWETENHRSHVDYEKLKKEDRQAYWN